MPKQTTRRATRNRPWTSREELHDLNETARRLQAIGSDEDTGLQAHDHKFRNANDARQFTLAGNATLTLQSRKTSVHYTYRVRQAEKDGEPQALWFVQLLAGPNNDSDFTYLGVIAGNDETFRLTKKSKMNEDSKPVAAFNYYWKHLAAGHIAPHCTVRHENHCGRCGRKLTVPESIDSGLGPDCRAIMGLAA
jgi:hypothetical protein